MSIVHRQTSQFEQILQQKLLNVWFAA